MSTSIEANNPTPTDAALETGLETVLAKAASVADVVANATPSTRAGWLRAIADDLDAAKAELVPLAMQESHLLEGRLNGELGRTTFQLRLTADALEEGSWLELTLDSADPQWPTGPRPELRRMLRALGPVLVVAASNFPFAFSVAGGDTATALGAGCPVVLKAHPGHPQLSERTAEIVIAALARSGAPAGVFALITGEAETQAALRDSRIKAGSFTGSVRGGRALFDIAAGRPDPVPFYGELGSVNPAFLLPSVAAEGVGPELEATLDGFVGSYTLGAGQFCTKPGILFAPAGAGIVEALAARAGEVGAAPLLNDRIVTGFEGRVEEMTETWRRVVPGAVGADGVSPSLFATSVSDALDHLDELFEESFGPTAVVVEYSDPAVLVGIAQRLPGQLTATVHGADDDPAAPELVAALAAHAGRIIWNGWPTGVSVSWGMQHGGGWPSTTASVHTSVGPTALRRFVAPVSYQNLPEALLPEVLRSDNPHGMWRRLDGELQR